MLNRKISTLKYLIKRSMCTVMQIIVTYTYSIHNWYAVCTSTKKTIKGAFYKSITHQQSIQQQPKNTMRTNSSNSETTTKTRTQRLRGKDFYHGMIQRADVEELLKEDGDFLLRKSINQQTKAEKVVLSVKSDEKTKQFIVMEDAGFVFFEHGGPKDKDIEALIQWMARKKHPITKASGCVIKRPIAKEEWVLTHESITTGNKIGQGQFGEVFRGRLKTASFRGDVAIKVLRDGELIENQKSFLDEARTMRDLRDENVIRTYGVAVYERPLMIVMELCEKGSLLKFLRSNRTSDEQKYKWITEAAKGMQYIAAQGLLHRDIAARNCLLNKDLILKIADFGLTIKTSARTAEVQGKVPVKWLARETLQLGTYSRQTDVWSYGILCWEVYNDGAEPYPEMTNQEAKAFVIQNNRMDVPNHIPTRVSSIMLRTWDDDPKERPSFAYIVKWLRREI